MVLPIKTWSLYRFTHLGHFYALEMLMTIKESVTFVGKWHISCRNATKKTGMQHLNYEEKLYFCNGFLHSESQKPVYKCTKESTC